jgi:glutamine transport system substrate-binding protein
MIRRKFWMSLVISCLTAITLVGCGASNTGGSADENTLIFAVTPDGGAFSEKDSAGNLVGFDIEIVEALAAKNNYKVEWKEMKFNGIIPALQAKQVDGAAAAITIREDRKAVTNFTDPYFESGLVMVVKADSPIASVDDLKDKTIVAKQGSSGLDKANELAKEKGAQVKVLEDEPTLYMDVEAGGSDVMINDFPFVASKMKADKDSNLKIVGDKLNGEDYGIAIAKGKEDVLEKFNKSLKEMKDNGEYKKIYDKYFGSNE